ncbi:MAG: orotidine 5'-phosphate decarboxylase [Candidatus Bathyarchaeota archaeon]
MFKEWIHENAKAKQSNIVLALDLESNHQEKLLKDSFKILNKLSNLICAVKINQHLTLTLGLYDGVEKIVKLAHELNLPIIMDHKISDIGNTNRFIAEHYFNVGFDALTAMPLPGWEEGLEPVFRGAQRGGRGVILIVYLSNKGAKENYERPLIDSTTGRSQLQYETFAEKAVKWGADGIVVGATRPGIIKQVYRLVGKNVPIYSPGVGVQGGEVEPAVKNGAKYLIVGRWIINNDDQAKMTDNIRKLAWKASEKHF